MEVDNCYLFFFDNIKVFNFPKLTNDVDDFPKWKGDSLCTENFKTANDSHKRKKSFLTRSPTF